MVLMQMMASAADRHFLVLSDAHVDSLSKHHMQLNLSGQYVYNDLDVPSFQLLLDNMTDGIQRGTVPKPKFIVFLGDLVGHVRFTPHFALNSETLFFTQLTKKFPNTPIFYIFGNNDSIQKDYGPFSSPNGKNQWITPLDVAKSTGQWKGNFLSTGVVYQKTNSEFPCIIEENQRDGYYAAYLEPSLRLIALNSVVFSSLYTEGREQKAAADQLNWLKLQLNEAARQRESVLLAMHIPPGINVYNDKAFWTTATNAQFLTLIKQHHSIIMAILAAHTHKEEVKVIQDSSHHNLAGVYMQAALSTAHGNAPSFRTYSYAKNNQQWQLTNYVTYHFIKNNHAGMILKTLYDYRHYYCNNSNESMLQCLHHITLEKLQRYFLAGNESYHETIADPQRVWIEVS